VIEAVGPGVSRLTPGDRIYTAGTRTGAYAEYAVAGETQVHGLPDAVSFSQGAGVWVPYGTAYHALHQATRARPSETVLVHGASGGVGTAAVQVARAMGLVVFGTAGTAPGRALVEREGAHRTFDHSSPGYLEAIMDATAGRGVDLIIEMLANVNLPHDLKLLAAGGRVVVIGNRGESTINARELMGRRGSIHAFTLWGVTPAEEAEIHAGLHAGLENGTLRPVVRMELPLAEAARAHVEIMRAGAGGKIVLVP